MITETYHPFEILILKGLKDKDSLNLTINSGKIYNFYNPSNYRYVKYKRDGSFLPELPFNLNSEIKSEEISLEILPEYYAVAVYILASFLPPKKWVPARSFIPKIDEAWVVFKVYSSSNFVVGETYNKKSEHIKYQSFAPDQQLEYLGEDIFETSLTSASKAFNIGIIGICEKDINGEWHARQFIKENLALTSFLDIETFENHNTELFGLSENYNNLDDSKANSINYYCGLSYPKSSDYRGYIRHNKTSTTSTLSTRQTILPLISDSPTEVISYQDY